MIPILFEPTEKDFLSNGICRLVDCLSCTVTEERNGIYECEFSYPVIGRNYDKITIGRIIYATHDDTQTPQPFDIYKRTANIDGIATFYARHIAYRLANVILKPFTANSCAEAVAGMETNTINANPFTFWTDKQVTGNFSLLTPRSVWSTLGGQEGSILDVYGKGTYEFDKWTVRLYLNRGRQTDVQLRYGKNLTDFEHSEEAGGVNAYVPFWRSSEGDTVVTVPGWVVIAAGQGGAEYCSTEDAEIITDENGVPIEVRPGTGAVPDILDLSDQFEGEPTPEQLQAETLRRLDQGKPWEPGENLRIDFAALWQSPEYEDVASLQRVGLCDTVSVSFPALGYVARVQIIKTAYNTLLDRYDTMELGQPSVTLASLIKRDVEQTVLRQVPNTSAMAQAIDAATKLITGGTGGHVVIATDGDGKPNEILIMDTEDVNTAVKVLRINQNGIGFSANGYNGPFKTAWTLDGSFVADFITTGKLNANLLGANSIKASKIDATDLFAQNIIATGKITGLQLTTGSNFSVDANGNLTAKNGNFQGTVTCDDGTIGGLSISSDAIRKKLTINGTTYDFFFQSPDPNGKGTTNVFAVRTLTDDGSEWEYPFHVNYQGNVWAKNLRCASINEYQSDGLVCIYNSLVRAGTLVDCSCTGTTKFGSSDELYIYYADGANDVVIRSQHSGNNCGCRLGTTDYPFDYVRTKHLTVNGSSVTSDRKLKNHIASLMPKTQTKSLMKAAKTVSTPVIPDNLSDNFIYGLAPSVYSFKNENTLDDKIHFGFYAQDVYELLHELCPDVEFGAASAVIKDSGDADTPYNPNDGERTDEELKWYLSYTELIAPLVAVVQKQKQQIDSLSARLEVIEAKNL